MGNKNKKRLRKKVKKYSEGFEEASIVGVPSRPFDLLAGKALTKYNRIVF